MQLCLEILRATHADDPFAFQVGAAEYVFRSPLGGAQTATLTWDPALLRELAALGRAERDPALLQKMGERLRQFLAPTDFARHLDEVSSAVDRGEPVRMTLRLAAAELYALPWELLALPRSGRHLGALPGVLLRYAWPDTATAPEAPAPRGAGGRILFCWSAAGGAVPAAEHETALARACAAGEHPFSHDLDVLPHVSAARLAQVLTQARAGEPIAVLHILCHGARLGATYGLAWDSDAPDEGCDVVDGGQLRELLAGHAGQLRLVVLAACDSGNSGQLGNPLGSIAQTLHRAGIAAVIASRHPLSVAGSIVLTASLYGALLGGPTSLEEAFLAARQRLQQANGPTDWAALQLYARPEDGDDSRPIVFRPYRGLEPFLRRHHRFFFGRERERLQARTALQALGQQGKPRLLIVAGASGTGKSSVVLGGLVPDLCSRAEGSEPARDVERALAHLRGALGQRAHHPAVGPVLQSLSAALQKLDAGGGPWEWAMMRPGSDPLGALHSALQERQDPARPFLLCVDQFEEIFTHTADPAQRSEFAARLWALANTAAGLSCVATLRVDFLGSCGELVLDDSGLRLDRIAYDEAHCVFVAQLEPAQLRAAICEPARLVGLQLPGALAERMVAEVEGEPGALPLLSYVLDLLWQRRRGAQLLEQSYSELGGVGGALGQNADRVWDSLPAADQRLARQLLMRLVGFSDIGGLETRRRVPLSTLRAQLGDPDRRLDVVLAAFVDARLLVRSEQGGQTLIEVAHEALIRKWERLQQFLRDDRERLAEVRELEQWATQYSTYRTLLRGPQLGYGQRLMQKYPDDLSPVITSMIRDSASAMFWLRVRQFAAIVCALAALTGLSFKARHSEQRAIRENRSATHKARIALSRLLGMYAERTLDSQPDTALLLATRAAQLQDELQSRSILFTALERTRAVHAFLQAPRGTLHSLAFSPTGQRLAATGPEPAIWVYDTSSGSLVQKLPVAPDAGPGVELYSTAWSPDGRLLAGGGSQGRIWLWDPQAPAAPAQVIKTPARAIYSLDWSADGKILAAGCEDGRVLRWDRTAREFGPPLDSGRTQLVSALSFRRAAGQRLAIGTIEGALEVVDTAAGQRLLGPLFSKEGSISSVAWSPDGRLLATGTEDRSVLLWDVASGQKEGEPLVAHRGAVSGIGFSEGGRLLASCGLDRAVYLWDLASRRTVGKPLVAREPLDSCALSPDGRLLAGGGNGQLVLWALPEHPASHRYSHRSAASALALDGRGEFAVVGGPDGSVRRLSLADKPPGPAMREGTANDRSVNTIAVSPDGKLVAAGGSDGTLRLRQADTLALLKELPGGRAASLLSVAFSPHGELLAGGFADGTLQIWELPGGRLLSGAIASGQQAVTALGFATQGSALITGGLDGSLVWRNRQTGAPLCPKRIAHKDTITSLAVAAQAPDASFATGSRDQTVALWSQSCTAPPVERLHGHTGQVAAVSLSPDGQLLASAGDDAVVIVWDVQARQPIGQPLSAHTHPITALAMGPQGLLLSGDEETVWQWDLNLPRWPVRACQRAGRNLSLAEWQQYLGDSPYCRICAALPPGSDAPAMAPGCSD